MGGGRRGKKGRVYKNRKKRRRKIKGINRKWTERMQGKAREEESKESKYKERQRKKEKQGIHRQQRRKGGRITDKENINEIPERKERRR